MPKEDFPYLPMKKNFKIDIDVIKTERMILEPQVPDHANFLFEPFQKPNLNQYISRRPPESIESLRKGIASLENRMLPDKSEYCLNWVMKHKGTEVCLGQIEISMPVGASYFYLAYFVFDGHQRKGYAKEACSAAIEYMFQEWQAKRVIIEMDDRNIASIKLAESLGAERTAHNMKVQMLNGEWSNEFRYELVKK